MNVRHRRAGVTLIELLVSVAIVAILASIAIPGYQKHRQKVQRVDGKQCLTDIQQRMEGYYAHHHSYTADLSALGYSLVNGSVSCGAKDRYRAKVNAATSDCPLSNCYAVVASARDDQTTDGDLLLIYKSSQRNPTDRTSRQRRVDGAWQDGWD
jgi:type IV pilus assembly protein PilE